MIQRYVLNFMSALSNHSVGMFRGRSKLKPSNYISRKKTRLLTWLTASSLNHLKIFQKLTHWILLLDMQQSLHARTLLMEHEAAILGACCASHKLVFRTKINFSCSVARIIRAYIAYHLRRNPKWLANAVNLDTPGHICEFITQKCGQKEKGFEGRKVLTLMPTSGHS